MTTEASAAAVAAPIETPIQQEVAPPTPIAEGTPPAGEAKVEPPKEVPSTRDALRAAAAKVEAREAGKVDPAADPAKDPSKGADLTRDPAGKFTPKDPKAADPAAAKPAPGAEKPPAAKPDAQGDPAAAKPAAPAPAANRTVAAPERFSNDAKAVWDTAPEPVKAEVDRMHREMTQGIDKYRKSAERDETVSRFHEMATRSGTTLDQALTRYTNLETVLRQNPMKGLEEVCSNIGISLRQVAEIVLGQTPDQARAQSDDTIRELRQTVQRLEQQVGGVTQTFEQQRTSGLQTQIEDWASKRPMFDLYAPHIATEIREGAANLDEAEQRVFQKYPQLAELAKSAAAKPAAEAPPAKPSASSAPAAPDLSAQTEKGSKSITGAPSGGSEPTARKPSNSIKEALKRAAARAG